MTIELQVPDMTCGHCVKTITRVVEETTPGAQVAFDLPTHRVTVTGTDQGEKLESAIREAGYSPTRL